MENVKPDSKRKILLLIVWAVLIALDAAGLVWNIVRFSAGTISEGSFSYSLLHFFVSIGTISAIFIAEWLLRFRAGTAIVICCMLFAFFGNTVSNVWHMYDYFPQWDMVLHSLSGVLFAVLGLGLASLLLRTQADGNAKVLPLILFALFFSLAVGYLWEVFEFTVDSINPSQSTQGWAEGIIESYPDGTYLVNSRRGTAILDTMQDMILHLAGSLVTLIPLTVLFFRRRETINRFSFTPLARRKKSSKKADCSDSENEENIEE